MASTLHVVAVITGKPGTGDDLAGPLAALTAASLGHDGCLAYSLRRGTADPDVFVTVEEWTDEQALADHLQTPDVQQALGGPARQLLAMPPQIIPTALVPPQEPAGPEGVTAMRIGTTLSYAGRPADLPDTLAELADRVRAGVGIVYVPEVYTVDAPSLLGHLAAVLPGVELGSDILPIYTRTPALTAMTAVGIDALCGGRFTLGLGASGPQVVEGFHGVRYDAPVERTREVVAICRAVWRRERLEHQGRHYSIPLTSERGGSGLGKPLKIINTPVRERIPVMIAAMGPRNVELAAEVAEQWAPFFFRPEGADEVWGDALRAGAARRDPALGPLGIVAPVTVAITDDAEQAAAALDAARPALALYVGGMGTKGKNFYHDLVARYGWAAEADAVQDLYLAGRRDEAAAALPADLLRGTSLVGPAGWVSERLAALGEAGVTTVVATPLGADRQARTRTLEALAGLV